MCTAKYGNLIQCLKKKKNLKKREINTSGSRMGKDSVARSGSVPSAGERLKPGVRE